MLNIISLQGNTNQNLNEASSHLARMAIITRTGENARKWSPRRLLAGMQHATVPAANSLVVPQTIKQTVTIQFNTPLEAHAQEKQKTKNV